MSTPDLLRYVGAITGTIDAITGIARNAKRLSSQANRDINSYRND